MSGASRKAADTIAALERRLGLLERAVDISDRRAHEAYEELEALTEAAKQAAADAQAHSDEVARNLGQVSLQTSERLCALEGLGHRVDRRGAAVEPRVTSLERRLAAVEHRAADAQEQADAVAGDLGRATQRTSEGRTRLAARLATVEAQTAALHAWCSTLAGDIAELKGTASDQAEVNRATREAHEHHAVRLQAATDQRLANSRATSAADDLARANLARIKRLEGRLSEVDGSSKVTASWFHDYMRDLRDIEDGLPDHIDLEAPGGGVLEHARICVRQAIGALELWAQVTS